MDNAGEGGARELVPIASFVPGAPEPRTIEAAFREAGIYFVMEGSRAYQISVAREDVQRAAAVLAKCDDAGRITLYPA